MRKYPLEHWKVLGEWVHDLRLTTPYSDTKLWAEKVGRSSRVLLGLERGEPVGAKTVEAVAAGLGIQSAELFTALSTGEKPSELRVVGDMREFIKEFMPDVLASFDEISSPRIALPDGSVVGPSQQDESYVASPGERKTAGDTNAEVLRELRAMQQRIEELSRRLENGQ